MTNSGGTVTSIKSFSHVNSKDNSAGNSKISKERKTEKDVETLLSYPAITDD